MFFTTIKNIEKKSNNFFTQPNCLSSIKITNIFEDATFSHKPFGEKRLGDKLQSTVQRMNIGPHQHTHQEISKYLGQRKDHKSFQREK